MLKNLKSLFIVEDEADNKETSEPKENKADTTEKKPAASTPPPLPNNPVTVSSEGALDNKIVEKLLQAIEKNNLDGFDYLEYKKSLKALEKMPMDEATKYRSAFATASTMGVTLDKLLQTTNFYIGVLDKENEQFLGAFKNQFDSKVSGREREIAQFQSIIKEKSEQIKKLTEEITKHQQQISDLKAKVEESNNKINKTQNDFKVSYSHLKKQFEEDIVKMQKYLK
ncbi:hypothetical protein [Aquimarina litoralis]|uniref:hypothetical protein n=1 Tax=Aquimarina litoralis TaxID=584605 RepID=UPI001C55E253|nr:hypothetical protein [Aquimarina litoralis]MBW1297314.1 hypothetical protein [Aquimarina litoralis]